MLRVGYSDEAVRSVIREHYEEKIMDVLASEWLTYTCPQAVALTPAV